MDFIFLADLNFTTNNVSTDANGAGTNNITSDANITSDVRLTDDQIYLQNVQNAMFLFQYITLPLFLIIGLFGNLMTIATMASKQFRNLTSRYLLIALAISDTTLILGQPFNKIWIIKLLGTDLRATFSNVGCKIFFLIFRTSKMTSSWLVVLLCFERFVAVVFPLKAKTIIKKKVIFPAIALDYILIGAYNGVWTFSSGIVNGLCKPDLPSIEHKVFVTVGVTIYSLIPSAILLIFTPQIMYRILDQVQLRRKMTKSTSSASRKEEEMIRASIMVVCVMIAYIILVLPISIIHIYSAQIGVSAFDVNSLGFFIFREVAQVLEQINYAINFFFYILCSSTFRRRVVEILHFSCCYVIALSRQSTMKDTHIEGSFPNPLSSPKMSQRKTTSTNDSSQERY